VRVVITFLFCYLYPPILPLIFETPHATRFTTYMPPQTQQWATQHEGTLLILEKQKFFHRRVVVREGHLCIYQQNSERGLTEMDVYVPLPEYHKARDSMIRQLALPSPPSFLTGAAQ
jgi:hypothetical protein